MYFLDVSKSCIEGQLPIHEALSLDLTIATIEFGSVRNRSAIITKSARIRNTICGGQRGRSGFPFVGHAYIKKGERAILIAIESIGKVKGLKVHSGLDGPVIFGIGQVINELPGEFIESIRQIVELPRGSCKGIELRRSSLFKTRPSLDRSLQASFIDEVRR